MEDYKNYDKLCEGLNRLSENIHHDNVLKGFWDNEKNVGELLMLVVTELSEALEAHRSSRFADYLPCNDLTPNEFETKIKDTFEDEIADAIIRLLDLSSGLGINIEYHIIHKLKYNKTRERLHGKQY